MQCVVRERLTGVHVRGTLKSRQALGDASGELAGLCILGVRFEIDPVCSRASWPRRW